MQNWNILKISLISCLIWYPVVSNSMQIDKVIEKWKNENFLTFSIPVRLDAIEPTQPINAHTKLILPLIYEPLVSVLSQQKLQPTLAESWQISPDNRSIVITIKQHHLFSDNSELTADNVIKSIYRACSPGSKVSEEIKGLAGCTEHANGKDTLPKLMAVGKYKIKFDITCSPTSFLYQLSSPSIVIAKKSNNKLIGSGPYVVQEVSPYYIVLKKNGYASNDIQPKNDGLVIFYENKSTLSDTLKNIKPDGSIMYRMQDIWDIKNSNYTLLKVNPNITEMLVFNNQQFPFNQPIIRKAIATNIYNHFDDTCIPGTHKAYGIIPNGTGGSIDNNPPSSLSPITPADVFNLVPSLRKNFVNITIHQLSDLKNSCEANQIIQAAKPYHININFKYHDNYSTLEPLYVNHQLDGFIELYVFRNREAYSILQFFSKSGNNDANIANDKIDSMLKTAISMASSHSRYMAYQEITKYMQNEAVVIPLYYMDHANFLSKCISGLSENYLFNPFSYLPQLYKINNCHPN